MVVTPEYDMADMPDYEADAQYLRDQLWKVRARLAAADALAVGVDEFLEMLEDDELTPDSVLEPIRVLLREYREAT